MSKDNKVKQILREYLRIKEQFKIYIVWKYKVLQYIKWLLSGNNLCYEVTYNKHKIDTILSTSKKWYHEDEKNHVILSLLLDKEQNTFSGYAGGMKIEDMASLIYFYMKRNENFVEAIETALIRYYEIVK